MSDFYFNITAQIMCKAESEEEAYALIQKTLDSEPSVGFWRINLERSPDPIE